MTQAAAAKSISCYPRTFRGDRCAAWREERAWREKKAKESKQLSKSKRRGGWPGWNLDEDPTRVPTSSAVPRERPIRGGATQLKMLAVHLQ